MAQISRLKDAEITNGNLINADDLDEEFNQLISESNSQDTRLTTLESQDITLGGVKTFSSTPLMNSISERTGGSGVTVDGVLLKDSGVDADKVNVSVTEDSGTLVDGDIWYNSTSDVLKVRAAGSTKTVALLDEIGLPERYMTGPAPVYASAATWTIKAGFKCRDEDNGYDIEFASDATASLASSGANGLDTGSEANDTWYYLYAIGDSTGEEDPAAMWSATQPGSFDGSTLPDGYDVWRWTRIAVRNNGSGNILKSKVTSGWPHQPVLRYTGFQTTTEADGTLAAGATNVLSAGTASSYTAVSCASFIPPVSTEGLFNGYLATGSLVYLSDDGSNYSVGGGDFTASGPQHVFEQASATVNGSQQVYYKNYGGANFYLDVAGFVVTEVS